MKILTHLLVIKIPWCSNIEKSALEYEPEICHALPKALKFMKIIIRSVGGVTVSMVSFQAADPGSTPGQRKYFLKAINNL
jgi:hypothetical protein